MENLLILTGPTGIGKTKLSLNIAENFNGEIISSDSMQIYKKMDIGTDKINLENTNIKHYMVDIVEPDEDFTVSDFKNQAKNIISEINYKNKLPIVVGGTGLYVNSLVYNLTFSNVEPNQEYRDYLENIISDKGLYYLYEQLQELDKIASEKIDKNNKQRIIRALEIIKFSDKKETKNFREENTDYNLKMIGLNMDRALLYERINNRVDEMFQLGLVDEVKDLLDNGYSENLVSMKAIGYKEIISYLNNEITLEESKDLIKKNSRHYAKRQLTWFRRDNRIKWFDRLDKDLEEKIYNYIGDSFERI